LGKVFEAAGTETFTIPTLTNADSCQRRYEIQFEMLLDINDKMRREGLAITLSGW